MAAVEAGETPETDGSSQHDSADAFESTDVPDVPAAPKKRTRRGSRGGRRRKPAESVDTPAGTDGAGGKTVDEPAEYVPMSEWIDDFERRPGSGQP